MKTLNTLISAAILTSTLMSTAIAGELDVIFTDIDKKEGNLLVALDNSQENYNGQGGPVQTAFVPADAKSVSYTFTNLESGTYAIKLFHDENSNGKLDTNMFGIPKEGYGFSNNVGRFGEPAFNDAAFEVQNSAKIEIIVR